MAEPDASRTVRRIGAPQTLRRKATLPVWAAIGWRVLLVLGLISLAIAVHWFDRDGLRDNYDGEISFIDVVYFTMISITTTGYGDIAPVTPRARLFDALIVTPIRIFIVLIFIGTAYRFVIKNIWDRWRMAYIQRHLHDHIVVAGFCTSGTQAVAELIARGTDPQAIVVIDSRAEAVDAAAALGCSVLQGDATRDAVLDDARVGRARAVVVSAGRDDTSVLITLTARHLAPGVRISVGIRQADNELLARQAGADIVINPVSMAGLMLASSCQGTHIADYLSDLASAAGRVQLVERTAGLTHAGHALRDLPDGIGLRLYRDGRPTGWWEGPAAIVQAGDLIVQIVPTQTADDTGK